MTRENESQALIRLASGCGEWCSRFIVLLPTMHAGIYVKKSVSSGAFCVASVSSQATPTEYLHFIIASVFLPIIQRSNDSSGRILSYSQVLL